MGGNPQRGNYERRLEIYSPAYLFNTDGTPAVRPTITGVTPGTVGYGAAFQVQTPNAAGIASVVLVRPGAPTHAFDMEQRLVGLSYTVGSGVLNVTSPPNGNIAPPGYYMLFVLNTAGVPSVARFVGWRHPTESGPCRHDYQPGGQCHPQPRRNGVLLGNRQRPGRHHRRVCLDVPGRHSRFELCREPWECDLFHTGDLRRVVPGDRQPGLGSSPQRGRSQSRTSRCRDTGNANRRPGGSTTYTATVAPANGFTGTVTFSVTGLPSGATGAFTPASVTTSGSTTLNVSTSAATPSGSYPLTIRGTSGPGDSDCQRDAGRRTGTSRSRRRRRARRSPGAASRHTT